MTNTKPNIVLIGCILNLTSKYLPDIQMLNFNPVVFYEKGEKEIVDAGVPYKIDWFDNNYQKTLAKVRSYHPVLILAGDEEHIPLTTHLQHDLHLIGNSCKYIDTFTKKDAMHNALKKAGVRYIRGDTAHSEKEAMAIYQRLKLKDVIIKPPLSVSSQGLYICRNKSEFKKYVHIFFTKGFKVSNEIKKDELLIQERIKGEEYFVNTVSRFGQHKVLQIWKYDVIDVGDNNLAFTANHSINKLDPKINQLIEYCKKALTALHIVHGPAHTEFFIDKKGPVMVEINCRIAGGNLCIGFSDSIFAHHDTDKILNALLFPDNFRRSLNEPYQTYNHASGAFLYAPRTLEIKSCPVLPISKRFKTFYRTFHIPRVNNHLDKTISFRTLSGFVHLLHSNKELVREEYDFLMNINKNYFSLLFEDVNHSHEDLPARVEKGKTLDNNISDIVTTGSTLILNDNNKQNVPYANVTDLKHVNKQLDNYANGIINLKKNYDHLLREDIVESTLLFMEKIRCGGKIYISERSANLFPYGFDGYKVLLKVTDFKVLKTNDKYLVGVKTR